MSRRRERRRNLRVQAAVETLEPRQLMHSGPGLMKAALGGSGLGGSGILPEMAILNTNLGPWGRLRLLDRLESQGDHQFDALGERLTVKFDHWALKHPALARNSGLKPTPLGSGNALKSSTQIASSAPPPNSAYSPGGSILTHTATPMTSLGPPGQPTLVSATAQSDTVIALAWGDVANETGFVVDRLESGAWTAVGTVGVGVTSYTDAGLHETTLYSYEVVATNASGDSAPSAPRSATTLPAAPTGLTATPVSSSLISLSWTNHSTTAAYNYVDESTNGTTWTLIGSVAASVATFSATGPFSRLTTYDFRVYAYAYGGGDSTYATAAATTAAYPYTPAINWAAPLSSTSAALSWTNAPGENGFLVERSANNGSTWTVAATVAAGVTTFTDAGLTEATSYSYRIVATNAAGDSIPSAAQAVATPPGAPTGLAASVVSGGQINLTWTDHSTAASYYYIDQSTDGTTWTQVGYVYGSTASGYTATGPFAGATAYDFRVFAYSYPGGDSAYATASATTPAFPSQPTLTTATAQSDTTVALTWTDVAGETGFMVERSSNSGSTWVTAGTVAAGATSFTDTGLTEATSYSYRIVATNAAGSSAPSPTLSTVTPPSAPTGLTASVVSGGQINLTWTDHSTAASYYYIDQSTNGTTWTQLGYVYGSTASSYTATVPFTGSTTYDFRVFAYSYAGGDSAYATASATTSAFPSQPTLTTATAQSDTAVALIWTDVAGETGFMVERSANNGASWVTAGTVAAGVTSFTDTGLTEATSYSYRVVATNAAGDSAPSATLSVATPPSAPTGLTATAVSPTQINLTWTDHSTSAYYYYVDQSTDGTTWSQLGYAYGSTASVYTVTGPFNGSTTYDFRVHAYAYTGGDSADAATAVTTPAYPSRPTIGSATAQSDTSVLLTWPDVAGETGFRVERSTGYYGAWTAVGTVGAGVTTFTDTGLHEATLYSYELFATNSVGDSAASAVVNVTTQPSAPTGLAASVVSGGQINLTWTDHSTAAYYYYIDQSTDGTIWTQVGYLYGSTASGYTATGPFTGSRTYDFRVFAYSYPGGGSAYATASATTPAFPSQPTLNTATAQSDTTVALTWTDVAGETGFLVERSANNGASWVTAGTVAVGVTSFTDTGLTEATSYMYQVVATNAAGDSAPSAALSVATLPSAPTGLTAAVVSGGQINLTWTDHSTAASAYYIDESTDGVIWSQVGSVSGSTADSYTAAGPFAGSTSYDFRVYAYAGGYTAYSPTASATTPAFPSQPTLGSATAVSDTAITLTWTDVAGETGFLVDRSANNGATWVTAGTVAAGVTSFTDTGLTEATSYSYQVVATNAAGDSAPSATLSVATQPSAPTGLSAVAVAWNQITLSWTDNSTAASYYYVDDSTNGTTWTQIGYVYGSTANSYTATGPFAGSTTYDFRVIAYAYTGGESAYSAASATTPAYPAQPTLSSATAVSVTAITLTWTDVAGETGFRVERYVASDGSWTAIGLVAAGVTTYTDAGLREGSSFTYRVFATNAAGDSVPSASMSATTPTSAPSGLTVSAVAWDQINLSWTDNSAIATTYYIEQSADGATWTPIGSINEPGAISDTATGPFNGSTTYYFRVDAYSPAGGSSTYATASTTTPAFPDQPTLNTATPQSDTAINLSWSDVAKETGFVVDRLVGGTWTAIATVAAGVTTFTDTSLHEATAYSYQVVATNSVGDSAPSATRTVATQPSAPSGLTATAVSPVQINLAWTDHSTAASAYYVDESTNGTTWTQVASLYGTATISYTATGPLAGSTNYDFRVFAYSYTGGDSAYATASATTAAFPNQPSLTATPQSDTAITLSWSDVANETGFVVDRLVGGTWTAIATVAAGVTTFTDTSLHEATAYSYQVVATNSVGDSAPSATRTVATQPSAPTGLTEAFVSPVRINLAWTDHSTAAAYYDLEQSTDGVTWSVVGSVSGTTADSYTATGPFAGSTNYDFRVFAYSYTGGDSAYATASATTPAFPAQPSLTATPQSDTAITLSWSDVANETGFVVDRLVGGTWTAIATVAAGVTTFTDTGLHEATSYSYQVVATNSVGDSAPSATQTVATLLDAPAAVTATFVSGSQINLSWTDHSSMTTGYNVEQSTDGVNWIQVGSLGATATSFTAAGPFDPSTSYDFRVQAQDAVGQTSVSPTAVATTPALPLLPTGLTATPTSDTSVSVTWTAMANADGYVLERSSDGANTWTLVATLPATQTTYFDAGLTEGETLYYRVSATDAAYAFVSEASDVSRATTLPEAPTGLQVASIDGGQVQLQWVDHSAVAAGYSIEQLINGAYQQIQTTAAGATSATVAGTFAPSTSYSFEVQAFATVPDSGDQYSLPSNAASITSGAWPVVPSNLVATAASATQIDLSWTDNAGAGANYEVDRSADGGVTWTQIASVPAGSSGTAQYADTGLTGGETANYEYQVRATIPGVGDSAYGGIAYATTLLATPTSLTATFSDGGDAQLTWVGNSGLATDYIVNELVNGQWQELQVSVGVVQSLTVYGVFSPSTTYEFQVVADMETATDSADSAPSNTATVTTAAWPAAPTNATTTVLSGTAVDLTWTDNATNATSYEVERSTDGVTWTVLSASLPSTATSYDDTGLSNGTMYAYRVCAVNSAGGSGYAVGIAATLPTAPLNLQATVVSGTEMDLSWNASADATGYTISIQPGGSSTWQVIGTVPATQTTYAATGLEPGGTYYAFCVAPTNSTAPSAVAYLDPATQDAPPTITGITTGTGYGPVTGTSTTLSVSATSDQPGGPLTYYWTAGASPSPVIFSNNNTTAAANTTVTFYMSGSYAFYVTVTDGAGLVSQSQIGVTVNQTLTGVVVTSTNAGAILGQVTQTANGIQIAPGNGGALVGQTQQFYATAVDQFGNPIQEQPSFTWSAAGAAGGAIAAGGLYTAPTTLNQDSTDTVTASSGGVTGTANVAVKASGVYQVQSGSITFHNGDHGAQEVVTSTLTVSNTGCVQAASPQAAVTQALTGTLVISGVPWAKGDVYQFPQDLTSPSRNWVKFQYAGAVFNAATSSYTVTVQFTDDDPNEPNDFFGTYFTIVVKPARLLELTVADANNSGNSVTANNGTAQTMYVPEDQTTQAAVINLGTLFSSVAASQYVHVRVAYSDGTVVFDGNRTSVDGLTLPVGANGARDFIVTAWIDTNGDLQPNPGVDRLEVDVSVVTPWTAQGTWTPGVAALVQANAAGASLQQLALDITGDAADAALAYPNMGPILKGDLIDVTPLLTILQQTVNNNIVGAAMNPNIKISAKFGSNAPQNWSISTIGEAHLSSLFSDGWTGDQIPYNCHQMAQIFFARGVQMSLQPGEFDQIGQNVANFYTVYAQDISGTPLSLLQPGNWANFLNAPKCPVPIWQNENTIVLGGGEYFGWGLGVKTEPELKVILMNKYNDGVDAFNSTLTYFQWLAGGKSKVSLDQIPGYTLQAYSAWAVNVPKLAQAVFNLRTGSQ